MEVYSIHIAGWLTSSPEISNVSKMSRLRNESSTGLTLPFVYGLFWYCLEYDVLIGLLDTLLKKLTSKVDGFTFAHFYLKVITSEEKIAYHQESLQQKVLRS